MCSCKTGLIWKIKWFCRQKLFILEQFPTLCHSKGAGHVHYDHQRKKFEPFWKELSYSTRGMQAGLKKKLFWAEEENSWQMRVKELMRRWFHVDLFTNCMMHHIFVCSGRLVTFSLWDSFQSILRSAASACFALCQRKWEAQMIATQRLANV